MLPMTFKALCPDKRWRVARVSQRAMAQFGEMLARAEEPPALWSKRRSEPVIWHARVQANGITVRGQLRFERAAEMRRLTTLRGLNGSTFGTWRFLPDNAGPAFLSRGGRAMAACILLDAAARLSRYARPGADEAARVALARARRLAGLRGFDATGLPRVTRRSAPA